MRRCAGRRSGWWCTPRRAPSAALQLTFAVEIVQHGHDCRVGQRPGLGEFLEHVSNRCRLRSLPQAPHDSSFQFAERLHAPSSLDACYEATPRRPKHPGSGARTDRDDGLRPLYATTMLSSDGLGAAADRPRARLAGPARRRVQHVIPARQPACPRSLHRRRPRLLESSDAASRSRFSTRVRGLDSPPLRRGHRRPAAGAVPGSVAHVPSRCGRRRQ